MKTQISQYVIIKVLILLSFILMQCRSSYISSAKNYIAATEYDKAIGLCLVAIDENPGDDNAYYVLGQAYGHKGLFLEMDDAFKKALELSDRHAEEIEQYKLKYWINVFNQGVFYVKQDEMNEAINSFSMAVKLMPDRMDAYKNLAYAYIQNDQDSLAIQTYFSALEHDPKDSEIKVYLGSLLYQDEKYEDAIKVLEEVISTADPSSQEYNDALYNIAYSYDLMGQSDKAIDAYGEALKTNPDDEDLIFNLGRLYFLQENYIKAIEVFKTVLSLDPDDFEANLNIGNAYIQIADSLSEEVKKTDVQGNLVLSIEDIEEKRRLADACFVMAIPYLEKATELKPDSRDTWSILGVAYVRAGYSEQGRIAFDKAESLDESTALSTVSANNAIDNVPPLIAIGEPLITYPNLNVINKDRILVDGYVIDNSRILHVLVNGMNASINDQAKPVKFEKFVSLSPGNNDIIVEAFDEYDNIGRKKIGIIQKTYGIVSAPMSDLWILSVGISKYENPSLNLRFADNDAVSIASVFKKQEGKLFRKVHTRILKNEDATRENILNHLGKYLNQASEGDFVLIFIAGHAAQHRVTGSYCFYAHDTNDDNVMHNSIKSHDFNEYMQILELNVSKLILLFDTCHAGAVQPDTRDVSTGIDFAEKLEASEGKYIISASKAQERSIEKAEYRLDNESRGHGAFTYAILRALSLKESDIDGNGEVMFSELFKYVNDYVPQLTEGEQHPYQRVKGTDLTVYLF